MAHTTPPRPVDIAAVFPALVPLARTATRLHPRPGAPSAQDSSIGGPLLWPASDPWPHCEGPHPVADLFPMSPLPDIRLARRLQASRERGQADAPVTQEERAAWDRVLAGVPAPGGSIPMLPLAQLYIRDFPGLLHPRRTDTLQVLWCPFDHAEAPLPRTVLCWRAADLVADVLAEPPEPTAVQYESYVPEPCFVEPEPITEYPVRGMLDEELAGQISEWDKGRDIQYNDALSVAPGWKASGWPPWGYTDPHPQYCPECGTQMEPLLTIASQEWDDRRCSWAPYEDQAAVSDGHVHYLNLKTPTKVVIGDNHNLQIYVCPTVPEHPHTQLMQ